MARWKIPHLVISQPAMFDYQSLPILTPLISYHFQTIIIVYIYMGK